MTKRIPDLPELPTPLTQFGEHIYGAALELGVGAGQLENAFLQTDPATARINGLSALSEAETDVGALMVERSELGSAFDCP